MTTVGISVSISWNGRLRIKLSPSNL